jgi:benzodiazapine receptor
MRSRALALAGFLGATVAAAALGGVATRRRLRSRWYERLQKPSWQPPARAFAPVWTTLYALIAVSGWRVWCAPASPARTRALALWGGQLGLNAAWSWLFFGAESPKAALADVGLLVPAVALYAREARRVSPAAAWLVAPYLGWTAFAAALNASIVRRNA